MLSWVLLSIIGGGLLLKIGYRPTTIAGFILLTLGMALLAMFQRSSPRLWLYVDLVMIGAGLGLTMLTLLIAVQQSVPRGQLGIATSLTQFSRSIGGAVGVAVMGTVLSAGLASHLNDAAHTAGSQLTPESAAQLAAHPNALIEPSARAALPAPILSQLQGALAAALHKVFWVGAAVAALSLLVCFWLPRSGDSSHEPPPREACTAASGERMMVAEITPIDSEHEPVAAQAD
jgi:MFS family permease